MSLKGTSSAPSKVDTSMTQGSMLGSGKLMTDPMSKPDESTIVKPSEVQQQQATGNQGQGETKPKSKRVSFKGKRRGKPGKIHIRLPSIEAYQKDLCFAAEAPGRVVVRLERLMGSDKIRPVDGKFMDTLIQRLEEEEKIAWERKIRLRKKAEKERYRQLAISGLMEPGPGMEDLYNHPVFRVNRILNRLSSLDSTFAQNVNKLPPILQIDPFENDDTGAFFKEYPYHRLLRKQCEKYKKTAPEEKGEVDISQQQESRPYSEYAAAEIAKAQSLSLRTSAASKTSKTSDSVALTSRPADIEEEDEYDEELEEGVIVDAELEIGEGKEENLTYLEQLSNEVDKEYKASLAALQKKYGVPEDPDFEDVWKPFQSPMVDKFIEDQERVEDIYEGARNLFDVYTRQAMLTKEHTQKNKNHATTKASKKKELARKSKIQVVETAQESETAPKVADTSAVPFEEPVPSLVDGRYEEETGNVEQVSANGEEEGVVVEPVPSLVETDVEEEEEG